MRAEIALKRLQNVPGTVRDSMMSHRDELPAGAISAVARFYAALEARGEHPSAPTGATFDVACGNESALGLLLRQLERHAPDVCLAEGRARRKAYYRARSGAGDGTKERQKEKRPPDPRAWPAPWLAMLDGLLAAPIKDSSITRHINSINRCADLVPSLKCPPRLGWLLVWEMAAAFRATGMTETSIANYIGGLVSLGLHGGLEEEALAGMRSIQASLNRNGRRVPKRKWDRVEALYERGGYAAIVAEIVALLEKADATPAWRAEAEVARATAAVLAVTINIPARTGDVADWRLGEELVREPWGAWKLRWRQEKNGRLLDAGSLWPEVQAVLDEHLLGGRPRRHAHRRYLELEGMNWLSFTQMGYDRRWPSEQVKDAIGVPLHDLRTLAADYLRLHDPVAAPNVITALLGHASAEAGEEYRALCTQTAAQREWREVRAVHAGAGG